MKVYDTRNKMPTVYCPWEHIDEQKTKYTKESKALILHDSRNKLLIHGIT